MRTRTENYDAIFRFCYGLTGSQVAAEDLTQETYTRFLTWNDKNPAVTLSPEQEECWLKRSAKNLCIDMWRSSKSLEVTGVDDTVFDSSEGEVDFVEEIVNEDFYRDMLSILSKNERQLLDFYLQDMASPVIAEKLNVAPSTVRMRILRLRSKLIVWYAAMLQKHCEPVHS